MPIKGKIASGKDSILRVPTSVYKSIEPRIWGAAWIKTFSERHEGCLNRRVAKVFLGGIDGYSNAGSQSAVV